MNTCGCKPGKYEDGWQEFRAMECEEAERRAWALACAVGRDFIARSARPAH